MSSDRNPIAIATLSAGSLVDWDMSSDRNLSRVNLNPIASLVDWDMSSDRNTTGEIVPIVKSLVDWDMSSDRRHWFDERFAPVKPMPAPRRAVYQGEDIKPSTSPDSYSLLI